MNLEETRTHIGRNVKAARLKAGFKSIRKMAECLSFSYNHLAEIESGKATASPSYLKEISEVTGFPYEALIVQNSDHQDMIVMIEDVIENGGDYCKAESLSCKLIEESIATEEKANALRLRGNVYLKQGKYRLAIDDYTAALNNLSFTRSNKDLMARISANISLSYFNLKDYYQALRWTNETLEMECTSNLRVMIKQLQGNIYANIDELDKALEIHQEILSYYIEKGLKSSVVQTHQNIGDIYVRKNQIPEAKRELWKAYELAKGFEIIDEICKTSIEICDILIRENDYENALAIMDEAIKFTESKISAPFLAKMIYRIGRCSEENEKRKFLFLKTYELCRNIDDPGLLSEVCFDLGQIFENENKLIEAIKYYKLSARRGSL